MLCNRKAGVLTCVTGRYRGVGGLKIVLVSHYVIFEQPLIIIVVIITWPSEIRSQKKTLTSQLSGSVISSNGLIYSKSRA